MRSKRSHKINDNTTKIIEYIIMAIVILTIGYFISQSKLFSGLGSGLGAAAKGAGDAIGAAGETAASIVSGEIFKNKYMDFCCANYSARAFICSHVVDDVPVISCNNDDTCTRRMNPPADEQGPNAGMFDCFVSAGKEKGQAITWKDPINTFNGKLIGYYENLTPIFKKD